MPNIIINILLTLFRSSHWIILLLRIRNFSSLQIKRLPWVTKQKYYHIFFCAYFDSWIEVYRFQWIPTNELIEWSLPVWRKLRCTNRGASFPFRLGRVICMNGIVFCRIIFQASLSREIPWTASRSYDGSLEEFHRRFWTETTHRRHREESQCQS